MRKNMGKLALPLFAVGMLVFAVYHVVLAQQKPPKPLPPVEPARTPFGRTVAGAGIVEARSKNIAIGSARLFGMKVPENFDWPYVRTNIAEFWKHWHISLYRWLVDYVFIPLGGSRRCRPRVYLNVLITMFLTGLWHGAGLNFVVW